MTEQAEQAEGMENAAGAGAGATLPPDDPARELTVVRPPDGGVRHIALAGDIYTILVTGEQTDGRYCLIDMRVPPGGGPPPHRHDFEEMFTLLEGEVEFRFRGEPVRVRAGETVNIPARAPHFFRNISDAPARMLCMCTPAGQDEYFLRVADPVSGPDAAPPELTEAEQRERGRRAAELAAQYRTELL
ncbi:cupin domain-containing protein [Streptomyces sp. NPDC048441]|uniref:cupin domain-containing protein n=1 Tax=Streptomyces sp. NPDC048441 TaxID=3365552 RepID=UPI0037145074